VVVRNIVASEADGVNAWEASYVRRGRATAPFCTPLCAIFRSRAPAPHVPAVCRQRPRELHARADVELAVDAREVDLDRLGRDEQRLRDLAVLAPSAARSATRRSLAVSDSAPLSM
jgi:hypothetical protein